jgi:hypothetical protein
VAGGKPPPLQAPEAGAAGIARDVGGDGAALRCGGSWLPGGAAAGGV